MTQEEIEKALAQLRQVGDAELQEAAQCFDGTRYQSQPDLLAMFRLFQLVFLALAQQRPGKQRTLAIDHLLISKDAAIRAVIWNRP
jgi:hypothetical protein